MYVVTSCNSAKESESDKNFILTPTQNYRNWPILKEKLTSLTIDHSVDKQNTVFFLQS